MSDIGTIVLRWMEAFGGLGWALLAFAFYAGIFIVAHWVDHRFPNLWKRQKLPGYSGRFCRPDGLIVHLVRLPSGRLMMVSEEKPGVQARDLGTATAAEVLTWEKLSTSPDGNDAIPRPL